MSFHNKPKIFSFFNKLLSILTLRVNNFPWDCEFLVFMRSIITVANEKEFDTLPRTSKRVSWSLRKMANYIQRVNVTTGSHTFHEISSTCVSSKPKAVHDHVPGCLRQIIAILSRLPRRGGHHVFHENAFYQGWHFSDKLVGFLLLVHLSLQPCVWHGFDGASRCLWLQDRCEEGVLFVWGSFGFMKCHARIPSYTPSFFEIC